MDEPFWINPNEYGDVATLEDTSDVDLFDFSDLADQCPEGWPEHVWSDCLLDLVPETDKDLAEHSLIYFATAYLSRHLGNRFAPKHYELCNILQDPTPRKRVLWLFPREHAKTTFFTFIYLLWCICYKKKANIVICSDSRAQAQEFLRNIKTELVNNSKLIADFGDLQGRPSPGDDNTIGKWDEQHIITSNGVQVKIWSPSSQVRGLQFNQTIVVEDEFGERTVETQILRPDLVVLDDILNDKHVKNKDVRDSLEKWLFQAVINALDSEVGDLCIVGTILHFDDLLNRLWKDNEKTLGWVKRKTPACVMGEDGVPKEVLWPGRWPPEKLLERQQQIGSLAFAKEFLLNPREEEAAYFSHEWFQFYADDTVPLEWLDSLWEQRRVVRLPKDLIIVTAIDPNTKDTDKADYTVVMTLGFCPSTRGYYVIEVERTRPSPEQQIMQMIRQALKHGRQYRDDGGGWYHQGFVIETIAYQNSIKYWLKKYTEQHGVTDARYYERAETSVDKTVRCSVMSPMAEQKRLYLPIGMRTNPISKEQTYYYPMQWLQDELNDFPMGSYDDGVDAMQRCYSYLIREERKYAVSGAYGPQALMGFDRMVSSHGTLKQYLNEKGL